MIEGMDELKKRLGQLRNIDLKVPTAVAVMRIQNDAKNNVPVKTGELRGSIFTSVRETEDGIEGICYTNKSYAPYVEFGTGPAGEESHKGISPDVPVAYRQTGWIIPANAMSEEEAEEYGFPVARDSSGKVIGYYTRGQPARPYMYPAYVNNKEKVKDDYCRYLQKRMENISK